MKKWIIANWKNLPNTWGEAEQILDSLSDYFGSSTLKECSVVICPPFNFLEEVGKILSTTSLGNYVELGVQDMAEVKDARYVIIGHSDRRWKLGESDDVVNQKLKTALENDLTPVVCIGERERGEGYIDFLKQQTEATFAGLSADEVGKCLIAYEPVWAISSNPDSRPDTPESALEAINIIKESIFLKFLPACPSGRRAGGHGKIENLKFLYGGSVTSKNVSDFLLLAEFSGVLVGGASVDREEFIKILRLV